MFKEQYFDIINFRKNNPLPDDECCERHHIVPKSICPLLSKSRDNIVRLKPEEHFKAHYYLWKWFKEELKDKNWSRRMCYAFGMMKRLLTKSNNIEELSQLYSEVRKDLSANKSEERKGYHHSEETKRKISLNSGRKGKHITEETRRKLSETNKGERHPKYGTHCSIETRQKMSQSMKGKHLGYHYWNNGIINRMARECPEGFVRGKLKVICNNKNNNLTNHQ